MQGSGELIRSMYTKTIFMRSFFPLAITIAVAIPTVACHSEKKPGANIEPVNIETLISANKSWNGDSYKYPRGKALMTLQRITAQPGFKTPLHSHAQPGIAYVVQGRLSCETINGQVLKVGPGESFATPQGTIHFCESVDEKAALVFVASAGVEDKEITVPYKD